MSEKGRTPPGRSIMGAISGPKGATFRVWAPHGERVYVTGTFNGWNEASTPLDREENGYWSAHVPDAKAGDEYRYLIHTPLLVRPLVFVQVPHDGGAFGPPFREEGVRIGILGKVTLVPRLHLELVNRALTKTWDEYLPYTWQPSSVLGNGDIVSVRRFAVCDDFT